MAISVLQRHQRRFHIEHLGVTLISALLCAALVLTDAPAFLNRYLYDRLLLVLPSAPDSRLLVVAIDDHSLGQLGRWPWDRAIHAALLEQLSRQRAKAVVYDLILAEPDVLRPESDAALQNAIEQHGRVYLPVHIAPPRPAAQPVEQLPWRYFAESAHRLGHVDLNVDRDGVVRSLYMRSGVGQAFWPHIALAVVEDDDPVRAEAYQRRDRARGGSASSIREHLRRIPFVSGAGTYPQVSAADLLAGQIPDSMIEGRIVLLGATAPGLGDLVATPQRPDVKMPGVEVHAFVLDALRHDRLLREWSPQQTLWMSLLLALIVPLLAPLLAARWTFWMALGVALASLLWTAMLLRVFQIWWPPGAVWVTLLLVVPLWTWRRLHYSLDYLRAALGRLAHHSDLSRRLNQPASLPALLRMIANALPVKAWRLENRTSRQLQLGGDSVAEDAWQGVAARHYSFQRGNDLYELSLLWRHGGPPDGGESWVRSMLERASDTPPPGGAAHEVVRGFMSRVRAEEQRQQALTRLFSSGLAELQDGVVIADACGAVLFANTQAMRALDMEGVSATALHLLDMARALSHQDGAIDWSGLLSAALVQGRAEQECRNRAGQALLVRVSGVDIGGDPGRVLMVVIKDVSELSRARQISREVLAFMSHDLRSPMISILALSEKMRQSPKGLELANFLAELERHARGNLTVAEQFLQLARVESMERIEMAELDMLPVVESAMASVEDQALERDIRLRFHYHSDDEVWVRGNQELLERLLVNLLDNAIRYSYSGSSVEVRLTSEGATVSCEVRDRGAGIPLERQSQIFERQQDGASEGGVKGANLGLRFVRRVAERHQGRVALESKPGEGSRFTLILPAVVSNQ